ncbi:MAG TPA: hypothetical protein VJV78_06530 [Polyangiales bacterium]|nr:hypothetical protein [Polyangiales bacterium]
MLTRRELLLSTLVGGSLLGLRALATGLPISLLAEPRRALAQVTPNACANRERAQYVIFATSSAGDPLNASVPGTYEDPKIVHSLDPRLAPAPLMLGGLRTRAAAPWAQLPAAVLERTAFWHIETGTPIHPREPDVLRLMGSTDGAEMLPSLLARLLAPCLGSVQPEPIAIGAKSPLEGLTYQGEQLPLMPAQALKATLTNLPGELGDLRSLRRDTLGRLNDLYKRDATPAQRAYIDSLVTSQAQVVGIRQDLLNALESIEDNGIDAQISAAVTLIRMNMAPVLSINIPFGGDNHHDPDLARETDETLTGVAAIGSLFQQLTAAGLADRVSLVSLNVFGRTLGPGNAQGRQHNMNHQVSLTIGKPFRSGIIGGVGPVAGDYGALPIHAQTGEGSLDGDIPAGQTLASFGKTLLAAFGSDDATDAASISSGSVVTAALARS